MDAILDAIVHYVGDQAFHLISVLAGLLALSIAVRKRKANEQEGYNLDVLRAALFGGATIAMMVLLALSTFSDTLLQRIVGQERFLLFFAALFAAANEVKAISNLWGSGGRRFDDR